jgi:hypothetical protein
MVITLEFEDTPAEIERAHRLTKQLMADHGRPSVSRDSPSINSDNTVAKQWWAALDKRIGPDTRRMAVTAAQMSGFGAWQELADRLGTGVGTVQSWHRNLGRSIKRVNAELGTDYQLFSWDVALNRFAMASEIRAAILET